MIELPVVIEPPGRVEKASLAAFIQAFEDVACVRVYWPIVAHGMSWHCFHFVHDSHRGVNGVMCSKTSTGSATGARVLSGCRSSTMNVGSAGFLRFVPKGRRIRLP